MNPEKRKLVDSALRTDASQQLGEEPRYPKAGGKADSIKHRLDTAESMVCKMAGVLASLLANLPEFKNDRQLKSHWFIKWRVESAEKLIKQAEELIAKRKEAR